MSWKSRKRQWGTKKFGYLKGGGAAAIDQYAVVFNGSTTSVNCGSDASLDDLHDDAMTVEAWISDADTSRATGKIAQKGSGWWFYVYLDRLYVRVYDDTSNQIGALHVIIEDAWQHVAFTYDDGGDRKIRIWVDGELKKTGSALDSAIASDAADNLYIGFNSHETFLGSIAWVRISDNIRYSANFTPPSRTKPPAVDANTVEQWNFNEGSGTTAGAEVLGANDGTISNGTWLAL